MTPEKTGHLTSLFAVGSSLLYYAVEGLQIEEMETWIEFEKGNSAIFP